MRQVLKQPVRRVMDNKHSIRDWAKCAEKEEEM